MALHSRWSDTSLESKVKKSNPKNGIPPMIELDGSVPKTNLRVSQDIVKQHPSLSEELDYVNIRVEKDKASRILASDVNGAYSSVSTQFNRFNSLSTPSTPFTKLLTNITKTGDICYGSVISAVPN
ncbi:hypothetical protein K438DRAFT_1748997 [Mycena galopus ATCC 62051]|nr:hypothetical protein K438DRAFT_1748997 [Mycena galopus ATCC 62051]